MPGRYPDRDMFRWGQGSPEGVIAARVGTIYHRLDGGSLTAVYVKESGTGSTGWKAILSTGHTDAADPHTGYVLESLLDAKGDLYAASADNTPAKVTVGANDTVLTADSAQTAGVKWSTVGTASIAASAVTAAKIATLPRARAYRSTDQSINDNTATAIALDSERYDTDSIHSTVTNTSRLTCVTAGLYHIGGCVQFDVGATGIRQVRITLNGTTIIALAQVAAAGAASAVVLALACDYPLAATDYVELIVLHTQGAALNVKTVANYSPEFWMRWTGP